jgi:hypothetical protein
VSYRAYSNDFAAAKGERRGNIRHRMSDNGWNTWYHLNAGNQPDICCFFQYMGRHQDYAMCIGFDTTYTMATTDLCASFVSMLAGTGKDGLLRDYIANGLPGNQQKKYVYVVDEPQNAVGAAYNYRLSSLFAYMQQTGSGTGWSLALPTTLTQVTSRPFWGNGPLNIWKLTVSWVEFNTIVNAGEAKVPNDPTPTPGSGVPPGLIIAGIAIISAVIGGIIGYLLHGWSCPC